MFELPPASESGFEEAVVIAQGFADDLLDEAGRVAKRAGAETASAPHVRAAGNYLYQGNRYRLQQGYTAVGGLLGGTGAGIFGNAILVDESEEIVFGLSGLALVVGIVMLTIGLLRH